MSEHKGSSFAGFGPATIGFLEELVLNNERAWFQDNKHRYEEHVLEPALAFISEMGPKLERISPYFVAIPKRMGGSLMRVYRDTRFSRDKTPYKTNIGIQFRHEHGKDVHAPGFYVHIEPGQCFVGVGLWQPDSKALAAIRERIVEEPSKWKRARNTKRFREHFALDGESLKRPPRGYPPDHPLIEDLKRRDFIASCQLETKEAYVAGFAEHVAERFTASRPFMRFLCEALELRF